MSERAWGWGIDQFFKIKTYGIISLSHHFEKEIYQSACKIEHTAQEMTFSMRDFLSKCDQIRSFLLICSHLLKKSLMGNFIFCAVTPFFKNTSVWLLLTGKHLCWSLFLILSILKNICERLLLWKYVHETDKN